MARSQSSIDKIFGDQEIGHLVVVVTPEMFTIFFSMKWHCVGPDFLTSVLFRNTFLWVACDEEATNSLNLWDQFIHGGGVTAVSDANTQALLKVVANLLLKDESINNLKRMEIVTSVLLPEGHGFLSHIREHITCFDNYERKWRNLAMTNSSCQGAKGAYHLQLLALRLSKYWR